MRELRFSDGSVFRGHPEMKYSHWPPQRLCQSQANAEIGEMLSGIKRRFDELGIPFPEIMVVDNCCHVRNEVCKCFPDIAVVLDVYHFLKRSVDNDDALRVSVANITFQISFNNPKWDKEPLSKGRRK